VNTYCEGCESKIAELKYEEFCLTVDSLLKNRTNTFGLVTVKHLLLYLCYNVTEDLLTLKLFAWLASRH